MLGVNPTDRQVRNAVLKALTTKPEYKVRIEVIRQTQPNILFSQHFSSTKNFYGGVYMDCIELSSIQHDLMPFNVNST